LLVDEMQIISLVYMVIVSQKHVAWGHHIKLFPLLAPCLAMWLNIEKPHGFLFFFLINMVFF
jgi:hypothetical protein